MDSVILYFAKIVRSLIGDNLFFQYIEKAKINQIAKKNRVSYPPIIIIGAPRSGTTLLYQTIINSFRLGYIPNIINVFYGIPVTLSYCFSDKIIKNNIGYKSSYGYIKGLLSPSEAGILNKKWFENNIKSSAHIDIKSISAIYQKPLIIKNIHNTYRINKIISLFPDALILFIERETIFNAQSILKNKKLEKQVDIFLKNTGIFDIEKFDFAEKTIILLKQVQKIKNTIEKDLFKNTIFIKYESFCKHPYFYLSMINKWLMENYKYYQGFTFEKNQKFENKNILRLNKKDYFKLIKKINNYNLNYN